MVDRCLLFYIVSCVVKLCRFRIPLEPASIFASINVIVMYSTERKEINTVVYMSLSSFTWEVLPHTS